MVCVCFYGYINDTEVHRCAGFVDIFASFFVNAAIALGSFQVTSGVMDLSMCTYFGQVVTVSCSV